jgi:outer membrane protein assembly factor BamB
MTRNNCRAWRLWVGGILVGVLGLLGCAGPDLPKPQPLAAFTPVLKGQPVWTQRVGASSLALNMALTPSGLVLAGDAGRVLAIDVRTGRELWSAKVGSKISAGVGSDGRYSAVVADDNELVVLDASALAWRRRLPAGVNTAPVVAGERVFVLGIDRSVRAFDAADGRPLWVYQKPSDALVLAQAGILLPFKDTLLTSHGSKLAALDPSTGKLRWEQTLATPRGTNEVERLADLTGPAARAADTVCARAFQVAVSCVQAQQGSVLWTRTTGGSNGLAMDHQFVLSLDQHGRATAWRTTDGSVAWNTELLLNRQPTTPVLAAGARAFVVGDMQGYVHWLSRDSGTPLLRLPTDGQPIRSTPVLVGDTVVVRTGSGGLFAFHTE